jgi:hypothetical protein
VLASHGQRGQTLIFWTFAIAATLGLAFFVMNYVNTIRWHIRAQNAADSAAMTTIAPDASLSNQRTIALYALAVDEYRIRSIMQSMVNAGNSVGGCNPNLDDSGVDCDNAYDQEPAAYDKAVGEYATALAYLKSLNTAAAPTPLSLAVGPNGKRPALPSAPPGSAAPAAFSLVASETNCWDTGSGKPAFDCAFAYSANPDFQNTGLGSAEYVEIVTCRSVSNVAPKLFFGLAPFQAVGRAAATLHAVTETFSPGTQADPDATPGPFGSPPPYQPIESCPPDIAGNGSKPCNLSDGWMATPPYIVDYSGLQVSATFYVPAAAAPQGSLQAAPSCKAG